LTYQSNQCATTPLIPLIKKMFARSVFLFFWTGYIKGPIKNHLKTPVV
jgi:hypothetical protein